MKKQFITIVATAIITVCVTLIVNNNVAGAATTQPADSMTEYTWEIVDDHEVRFLHEDGDTFAVLFENAYALAGQNNVAFLTR